MAKSTNTGCLGLLLAPFLGGRNETPIEYPYGKRDAFLSPAEISFFHVVSSILPAEYHLLTEVRISDLVYVKRPHENQSARNRIDRKHVDFVICKTKTMEPKLIVELDDKSHERADRMARDVFVDEVFRTAGIPIVHVPAMRGYQPDQLRKILRRVWKSGSSQSE